MDLNHIANPSFNVCFSMAPSMFQGLDLLGASIHGRTAGTIASLNGSGLDIHVGPWRGLQDRGRRTADVPSVGLPNQSAEKDGSEQ